MRLAITLVALHLAALSLANQAVAADIPLRGPALPAAMLGIWAYEPGDCRQADSDGLVTVEPGFVVFFASAYQLIRVVRRSDRAVSAYGWRSDEGEEGRTLDSLTLELTSSDLLFVVANDPKGHTYHRCAEGPA